MADVRPLARTEEDVVKLAKAKADFIIPHDVGPEQLEKLTKLAEKKTGKSFDKTVTYKPVGPNHGLTEKSPQMQDQLVERTRLTQKSLIDYAPRGMKVPRAIVGMARKLMPGMNRSPTNAPQNPSLSRRQPKAPTLG